MIPLTPMEIRRHTFKKGFKGYDTDEVNLFVETMAARLEEILGEKEGLLSEIKEIKIRLEKYEKLEQTLQDMLLHSQKTVEEAKTHAERQSSLFIREAEVRASEIKKNAEHDLEELKKSIAVLKDQKKMFLLKFRTLVKSQTDMLTLLENDDVPQARKAQVNLLSGEGQDDYRNPQPPV
jgi:cell division initiation protein